MPNHEPYKYYLVGDTVPVRVNFNDAGLRTGAEVPDKKAGMLVHNATYLSKVSNGMETQEITEKQFHHKCREILGHKMV